MLSFVSLFSKPSFSSEQLCSYFYSNLGFKPSSLMISSGLNFVKNNQNSSLHEVFIFMCNSDLKFCYKEFSYLLFSSIYQRKMSIDEKLSFLSYFDYDFSFTEFSSENAQLILNKLFH